MTIAERLRATLERGHARETVLLESDFRDAEVPPGEVMLAAVLVAVVDRPNPTVILTVRHEAMRKHPGQVAFPGGRIDAEDDGPIGAALREAEEEIGLSRDHVDVIGMTDSYRTITGFDVTPVVGVVPPGLELTPHAEEVAEVFEAPLDFLLEPGNHIEQSVEWQGRERHYYEINWQGRRIWGATAAMIVNLGRRLAYGP
ncbi:MAG: CoA pyrophosphatase [Sphingomonadaceae bacterium]|nr:CoA pyrophosphatase [Sphingomonadaceae bacterium]